MLMGLNINDHPKLKQAISACEWALCQLAVLSFRVELTEEKDSKVVSSKWYSEATR